MKGSCATVLVHRPGGHYIDMMRSYHIVLDGERVGTVARGRTARFEVAAPGRHCIRVEIDWTGSPELEFVTEPDDEIHLTVQPRATPLTGIFYIWGRTSHLSLGREGHQQEQA